MRHEIDRYQDAEYSWLERQLYSAYKNNQVVIVNQHRFDADAGNLKNYLINIMYSCVLPGIIITQLVKNGVVFDSQAQAL